MRGGRLKVALILVPFVVAQSGCSVISYREANKFLESQQYIAAEQAFKNILERHPNDPRAMQGLHQSREGVIDKRLLEVRFLRLAGNADEALDSLKSIVDDENNWQLFPRGPVFFTQREETKEALKRVSTVVHEQLTSHHPVPAKLYLEKYSALFGQGEPAKSFGALNGETQSEGKSTCLRFAKSADKSQVYFRQFVSRYCSYWGQPVANIGVEEDSLAGVRLYKGLLVDWDAPDLPTEMTQSMSNDLEEALHASPFFHPKGQLTLRVRAKAQFADHRAQEPVSLTQEYTTQEPYTSYEPVMKSRQVAHEAVETVMRSRQVAYQDYEYQYDYYSRRTYRVPVTRYRTEYYYENVPTVKYETEFYYENEPVTRYKTVPHAYEYQGTEYRQNLTLLIDAKAGVERNELPLSVNKQESFHGISHNENLPDIGLYPKPVQWAQPVEWIHQNTQVMKPGFEDKLRQLWVESFCRPKKSNQSDALLSETVHKCLRSGRGDEFGFVDQWFKNNVGLAFADAPTVLKN